MRRKFHFIPTVIFTLLMPGCSTGISTQSPVTDQLESNIRIPAQADWVDYGIIFEAGVEGEWDYYLWGGFAFSIIKKNDTYYLYYQGSSDYRTEFDETV